MLAWFVFLPVQYGGKVVFVIIDGISMEPGFHQGDLVVLRARREYHVGEAVAYYAPDLQTYVFHRIVAEDRDRFLLKGDNNGWVDLYSPAKSEIVGKEWFRLPALGQAIQRFALPLRLVLVGAVGSVIGVVQRKKVRSQGRRKSRRWFPLFLEKLLQDSLGVKLEEVMMILGTLALISFILGVFAFMNPVWRTVTREIPYEQQGEFSYTGRASGGVYEADLVQSGDPLFLQLVCQVQAGFRYRFSGEQAENLAGKYTLYARVSTQSGWQRKVVLQPEQAFQGDAYQVQTDLDVCQFDRLIEEVNLNTGISASRYQLEIVADTRISGKLKGKDFQADFSPKLVFSSDRLHLWLEESEPGVRPLRTTSSGFIPDPYQEVNTLPFFNLQIGIPLARLLAVMGMGLSIATMIFLNKYYRGSAMGNKDLAIRMKYGHMLVDVQGKSLQPSGNLLDVSSVDDLARLAEKYDSMILHASDGQFKGYLVQGNGLTYRFHSEEQADKLVVSPLTRSRDELAGALGRFEFLVHYQPVVSFREKSIVGVEALLRWNHPQKGLVPAGQFINTAFESGLIETLDGWTLKQALSQLQAWHEAGFAELALSANLSLRALKPESYRAIVDLINHSGVAPGSVQLEFTELDLIEASPEKLEFLNILRSAGVAITMDNFSGKVPLDVLARLPISCLKVYLLNTGAPFGQAIPPMVTLGISVAQSLGLKVIVAGIESEKQLDFFQGTDIYAIQGYLLGKPNSAEEMTRLLKKSVTW